MYHILYCSIYPPAAHSFCLLKTALCLSMWLVFLLFNKVCICDFQMKECDGHNGWFSSIYSGLSQLVADYWSEPVMVVSSSLTVTGSAMANAGKLLKPFLLRGHLRKKYSSSSGNDVWTCCFNSVYRYPEAEGNFEKLADGKYLSQCAFSTIQELWEITKYRSHDSLKNHTVCV